MLFHPVHGPPLTAGAIGDGSRPVHDCTGLATSRSDGHSWSRVVPTARWEPIIAVRGKLREVPEVTVTPGIIFVRVSPGDCSDTLFTMNRLLFAEI